MERVDFLGSPAVKDGIRHLQNPCGERGVLVDTFRNSPDGNVRRPREAHHLYGDGGKGGKVFEMFDGLQYQFFHQNAPP